MPHREIIYTSATKSLTSASQLPTVISTELGNVVLEIQGELVLPTEKPDDLTPEEEERFTRLPLNQHDGNAWAVKFGKLELDGDKATLFIGTTQRLLGSVKKIDPPLALLKFPESEDNTAEQVEIVDVLRWKIIFTGRPLPIM